MSTRLTITENSRIEFEHSKLRSERLTLANSTITFEVGPIGTIARIDHRDGSREYAGPIDDATIAALREVAHV